MKHPVAKRLNTISILPQRMEPFNLLLCLTPDDFTHQRAKSRWESVKVERSNQMNVLIGGLILTEAYLLKDDWIAPFFPAKE